RNDQALTEIRNALLLDPLSSIMNVNYAYTLFAAHRYDEAAQQFRKSFELDPNSYNAHWKFSVMLAVRGQWAEAVEHYRIAAKLEGDQSLPQVPASAQGYEQLVREHLNYMSHKGLVGDI